MQKQKQKQSYIFYSHQCTCTLGSPASPRILHILYMNRNMGARFHVIQPPMHARTNRMSTNLASPSHKREYGSKIPFSTATNTPSSPPPVHKPPIKSDPDQCCHFSSRICSPPHASSHIFQHVVTNQQNIRRSLKRPVHTYAISKSNTKNKPTMAFPHMTYLARMHDYVM